jgi:hypothetical protein
MGECEVLCQWCEVSIPLGRGTLCHECQKAEDAALDDYNDDCLTREEEDAAEAMYLRSRARAEWDHYHPGEPCPEIELPPLRGKSPDP